MTPATESVSVAPCACNVCVFVCTAGVCMCRGRHARPEVGWM